MTARVRLRLSRLLTLFPRPPCEACRRRPALLCVETEGDPVPDLPAGRCPVCGRQRWSVPVAVGVDCELL